MKISLSLSLNAILLIINHPKALSQKELSPLILLKKLHSNIIFIIYNIAFNETAGEIYSKKVLFKV